MVAPEPRRLLTAELLSIGTEITVGDTRDTNAGELARSLTARGVDVLRVTAVPDDLLTVTAAFAAALERADMVVSTGGLGPTPDDLTREAIAAVCGERPAVDPDLEAWLRQLWDRRGMAFPELNLKQAWLIPSATSLANPNGTAPGWFVTRPDGRVVVAMPGPPREMRPMWSDEVVPRLEAIGLGRPIAARTYRLAGIGESQVAELLGETMLRATNPLVATYARAEAVDVRISAVADGVEVGRRPGRDHRAGRARPPRHATCGRPARRAGATPSAHAWVSSAGRCRRSRSGRAARSGALFADLTTLRFDESIALDAPAATAHGAPVGGRRQKHSTARSRSMTSSAMHIVPGSSAVPRSGWRSAAGHARATWLSRSRSRHRPATGTSSGPSS